jgi:hypothetical protein
MADVKISQLPVATTPVVGTEVLPIVQSSITAKVSIDNLTAGRAVSMTSVTVAAGAVGTPSITTAGDTNTGIYFPAADTMAFVEGGAEAARITSAGNFGVGTTNPVQKFVVSNGGAAGLEVEPAGLDTGPYLQGYNRSTAVYVPISTLSSYIAFRTGASPTESARIDSSGNLLVGTTTSGGWSGDGLVVGVKANGAGWAGSFYKTSAVNVAGGALLCRVDSTTSLLANFYFSTTSVGTITTNGTITVYGTTSDYRLKTVIGPVADAGQRIDALQPVEYTWNSNGSRTRGFLAHQFQEVYVDSVTGNKDAVDADGKPVYQAMQAGSSEVIADLVAEIQSLRKRLTALESN